MLAQDYAFGRDGVKAVKEALAAIGSKATVVHENTCRRRQRLHGACATHVRRAEGQARHENHRDHLGGPHPLAKIADLKPERYGIAARSGGNILPVMKGWKQFAGSRARSTTTTASRRTRSTTGWSPSTRSASAARARLLHRRRMAAGIAIVEAIKKAGSTDTEKLIAAMEGLSFESPKGTMTFRKEDHQAMQPMYHFRIKKAQATSGICWSSCARSRRRRFRSGPQQALADESRSPSCDGRSAAGMPMAEHPVLETRELTIRFGGHVAVDAVSCRFSPGRSPRSSARTALARPRTST
jgi:hypothetical protein